MEVNTPITPIAYKSSPQNEGSYLKSKLSLRKRLWKTWASFVLQQYKADEVIDIRIVQGLFVVYFLIIAIGLTNWQGFDQKVVGQSLMTSEQASIIKFVLFIISFFTLLIYVAAFSLKQHVNSTPNFWHRTSAAFKHVNWYLITPLSCLMLRLDLFAKILKSCSDCQPASPKEQIFGWVLTSLNLLLCILHVALRSELPTKGKFNSPNKYVQAAHYTVLMLLITVGQNLRDTQASSAFAIVSKILGFSMIVICWRLQVFWWYEVNRWYVLGHLGIVSLRNCISIVYSINKDFGIVQSGFLVLLFVSFILKVGDNICIYRLRMALKWAGHDIKNFEHFIVFFTAEICKESLQNSSQMQQRVLPSAITFELSMIGRYLSKELTSSSVSSRDYRDISSLHSSRFTPRPAQLETIVLISTRRDKELDQGLPKREETEREFENPPKKYDALQEYLQALVQERPNKSEELWILLLLQLIFLRNNLLEISVTLSRYRKSLGSRADTSLNLFLIETMLKSRLESISTEDSISANGVEFSESWQASLGAQRPNLAAETRKSLWSIFSEIWTQATLSKDNSIHKSRLEGQLGGEMSLRPPLERLDMGVVLDCKHEYLTIISGINWFLDVKSDIFSMLFETYAHKSFFLYKRNALARKLTMKIDKAIFKLMSWSRVPNYVYSAAMAYFLKIRFDLQKSEKIFKIYKANIFKYQTIANKQVHLITEENFMYNSVIMKIKVAQDLSLGAITDITSNYMEHMGEPANEEAIKVNINTLFPGKMMQVHSDMMRLMTDEHIFNRQKDFQLNGFDGHLRPIKFTLKMDSDVSKGLNVVALLKFYSTKQRYLLLVDQELNVVSAEPAFWNIMGGLKALESGRTLWGLSQSLAVNILLSRYLNMPVGEDQGMQQNNPNPQSSVSAVQAGSRDAINSSAQNNLVLRQIQQIGQQRFSSQSYTLMKQQVTDYFKAYEEPGMIHLANEEIGIPGLPIFSKTEFTQFGQDNYCRVWLSFDLNFNKDTRNLMTTQLIQEENRFSSPTPLLGYGTSEAIIKLSESETKDKHQHGPESVGSGGFQILASLHNDLRVAKYNFEQILQHLKSETPIVALITEALTRSYPEEIKTALGSLRSYLKNLESQEVIHRGEHRLSAVISQMTPVNRASQVNGNLLTPQEYANLSDINTGQESPNLARYPVLNAMHDTSRLNFLKPSVKPTKSLDIDELTGSKLGPDDQISSQPTSFMSKIPEGSQFPRGEVENGSATNLGHFGNNPTQKQQIIQQKTGQIPVIKLKAAKVGRLGNNNMRKLRISDSSKQKLKFATTSNFNKAMKQIGRVESPSRTRSKQPPGRRLECLEHKVTGSKSNNMPSHMVPLMHRRQQTVEEADERHEALGSEHKGSKLSLMSQLSKRLVKFRSLRNNTHDHSEKKRAELNPLAISTMAKADAFISQNETNLKVIARYISDFKAVKRSELSPDEKNNSVSASNASSSSRGSYFFKTVTSTLESSKRGSSLYLYTAGLAMFSLYFFSVFQYLLSELRSYNTSTLNSFNIVNNFITIDRKLIQSCEVQDYLYGLSSGLFNKSDYMYGIASFARLLPKTTNGSVFLMGQLKDIRIDIYNSMQQIIKGSITSVDEKDLNNVNAAAFHPRKLTYWGDLITPEVYNEWTLPYFTVLMYYCNILNSNYLLLRDVTNLAWRTNYNFTMDVTLTMRYNIMVTSKTSMNLRIYDAAMKDKDEQFDDIIKDVITTAADRYFAPVYIMIYLSIGVSVCMLGYSIYTWLQINNNNSDYLENYNLLRPWELYLILEENEKSSHLFTANCLNEIQMVNQYMEMMYLTRNTTTVLRVARLEQRFSREKDKMISSYKFSHDFYFLSSKFGFFVMVLSWGLLMLTGATFYTFFYIDERRLGMEKLYFDSHRNMLRTTKYFLTAPLLTTYGYAIPVSGQNIANNPFTDSIDSFVAYQAEAKQNYSFFFQEKASLVERVNFGDICGVLQTDPVLNKLYGSNYNMCKNMNQNSAQRGMLGFLLYEKSFIEMLRVKIQTYYSEWLEQSKSVLPIMPLFRELFEPQFLELRVGHRLIYNIYYQIMGQTVVDLVTTIKSQLDYFDDVVMQSICMIVFLGLIASFNWLVAQQREELSICYETFRIIDPYFVVNNRYLQFKFRAAFKGVE